jgi:ubiquinol-cytochrome c reductase cytochrome c1 subunit
MRSSSLAKWTKKSSTRLPKKEVDAEGNEKEIITGYEMVTPGKMDEKEFDQAARDLTNFLVYTAEPIKLKRQHVGIWVLLFLALLFVVSYALKKEYWKDVH